MPTYEYACRNCGHGFDVVQSMTDAPLTICDECGGELRKVFAPPAISFKGSGFYATDHGRKTKEPSEKPAEKKDEKKESKPSESTGSAEAKSSETRKETTST